MQALKLIGGKIAESAPSMPTLLCWPSVNSRVLITATLMAFMFCIFMSCIFMSCNFIPCYLVCHFHVLHFQRPLHYAVFGRWLVSRCLLAVVRCVNKEYGAIGCSVDVLSFADSRCSGRPRCTITVADFSLQGIRPCPEDLTSYFEAGYRCVPGKMLFVIGHVHHANCEPGPL